MSYLQKHEVFNSFAVKVHPDCEDVWELFFTEGGKVTRVAVYYTEEDVNQYWEEDALAYWMNVLKRTWDDDEGTFFPRETQDKINVLKFRGDYL